MRRFHLLRSVFAVVGCLLFASSASAIRLSFAHRADNIVEFHDDGSVSFGDFRITASSNDGSSIGLVGTIDGVFEVHSMGFPRWKAISGSGSLSIDDAASHTLTGEIFFDSTRLWLRGRTALLNLPAALVLTNIAYEGSNPDLMALSDDGRAIIRGLLVAPARLTKRVGNGGVVRRWRGVIQSISPPQPVPEPSAALCFALGALVVGRARASRRRR